MANGATVGSAYIKLGVQNKGFSQSLNNAKNSVSTFGQALRKNVGVLGNVGSQFDAQKQVVNDFATSFKNLGGIGPQVSAGLTAAGPAIAAIGVAITAVVATVQKAIQLITRLTRTVINFGKEAVKTAGQAEKMQTIMNSRLGDAVGDDLMKKIRNFAATYGLAIDPLVSATHTLLDFGYQADQIPDLLYNISGAAAQAGGDVNGAIGTISQMLGRIQMTGVVTKRQLDSLQQNGISIYENLSEYLGVGTRDVLGKLSQLSPSEVIDAITRSMEASRPALDNFADTYEARVQGLKNTMEDFKITIGEMLLPYLKKAMIWLQSIISVVSEWVSENKDQIVAFLNAMWEKLTQVVYYAASLVDSFMKASENIDWVDALNTGFEKLLETIKDIYNALVEVIRLFKTLGHINNIVGTVANPFKMTTDAAKGKNSLVSAWDSVKALGGLTKDDFTGAGKIDKIELPTVDTSQIGAKVSEKMAEIEGAYNHGTTGASAITSSQNQMVTYLEQIADNTGTLPDMRDDDIISGIPLEGY